MDLQRSLAQSTDSKGPALELEAHSANSSNLDADLLSATSDSTELDITHQSSANSEQLPHAEAYETCLFSLSLAKSKSQGLQLVSHSQP